MAGDKANMSKSVDFGADENNYQGDDNMNLGIDDDNSNQNQNNQQSSDDNDNVNNDKSNVDQNDQKAPNVSPNQDVTSQDLDLDDGALVLWEDENNIFTSDGIISKSSVQKDNSDNNNDAEPEKDEKIFGKFKSVDDLKEGYKNLEKKLGKGSDAIKQLKELEPVLPVMEAMLNDPNLLDVVDSYFNDPEAQKEAVRKSLGLDEDFEFDLEKALSDPKSDDAKILDKISQRKNASTPTNQQGKNTKKSQSNSDSNENQIPPEQREQFIEKHNMSNEEFEEMMQKASDYQISLDDIYFLMNKDKVLTEKEKEAQEKIKTQMKNARDTGKTSGNGGGTVQKSAEDAFMDAISDSGGGLFG